MRRFAVLISAVLFGVLGAVSQEKKEPPAKQPEFKIPEEDSRRENPVKRDEGSIATGKRLHASQCAMCHGDKGDGKGELVETMKLKLRDWHDPAALKDMTDGDLFYILTRGKGDMPGQQNRLTLTQKWHLVNFIRSLAKK